MSKLVFAVSVAALGVLLLGSQFVYVWAPLPRWVPWEQVFARTYGALLLVSAAGLAWRKTERASSLAVALLFLGWLVLLQVPRLAGALTREVLWSGAAQLVTAIAGGWILFASRGPAASPNESRGRWFHGPQGVRIARRLYAAALPMFGAHHFLNATEAVAVVPAWLPLAGAWVYLTGIGHVAAGAGILLGVLARPAAALEAVMITSFVLVVHVPAVVGAPKDGLQWSMLVVASVIGGAAWVVARSYSRPAARAERDQRTGKTNETA